MGGLLATALLLTAASVAAAPERGGIYRLDQPGGDSHEVRVWGDEFYRTLESLDGYTLVKDPKTGLWCYAEVAPAGDRLLSTGIPLGTPAAQRPDLRKHLRLDSEVVAAKALAARQEPVTAVERKNPVKNWPYPPCDDANHSICLLIDFRDEPANIPAATMADFINQKGYTGYGNNGSVRDYFTDASGGRWDLTHEVPLVYYRAVYTKAYYENPAVAFRVRAGQLVEEALDHLDAEGFDFTQFDCNDDGLIDGLTVLYAGEPRADGGLWPHAALIDLEYDGLSTLNYALCDIGTVPSLAVFVHELGHALGGFPDLYDYGGDSEGAGRYCLMTDRPFAPTEPAMPSALCRSFARWCDQIELTDAMLGTTLPVDVAAGTIYRYSHPTVTSEYFLIENRQPIGRDATLPDNGLAIWHIDHTGCNDFQQGTVELHYLTTLLQADGRRDLENDANPGDDTDLWAAPGDTDCTPDSWPNTRWWDGSDSGLFVTDISASAPVMTFVFGASPAAVAPDAATAALVNISPNPFNPRTEIEWRQERPAPVRLAVHDLRGQLLQVLVDGVHDSGRHRSTWDGCDATGRGLASGAYMVSLEVGDHRETRKVVLLR